VVSGLSTGVPALLALIGLIGGVGISAVGPGGVLPTIGLFVLTPLAPATVAGTAIATNIATGIAGTAAYTVSGQLRDRATRRTALILSLTAVVGTPPGVLINAHVSKRLFGILLAVFAVAVAFLVWQRGRSTRVPPPPRDAVVAGLGLAVGVASGLLGLGGPLLTVPLLIALGVATLEALAAAQAQSVVIATVGTIGYAVAGRVDWALVLLIGLPELAGVLLGWRVARALPTRTLRLILIAVLLALAPYLALRR
jgi:uncharacterized membrane protein YfcA